MNRLGHAGVRAVWSLTAEHRGAVRPARRNGASTKRPSGYWTEKSRLAPALCASATVRNGRQLFPAPSRQALPDRHVETGGVLLDDRVGEQRMQASSPNTRYPSARARPVPPPRIAVYLGFPPSTRR